MCFVCVFLGFACISELSFLLLSPSLISVTVFRFHYALSPVSSCHVQMDTHMHTQVFYSEKCQHPPAWWKNHWGLVNNSPLTFGISSAAPLDPGEHSWLLTLNGFLFKTIVLNHKTCLRPQKPQRKSRAGSTPFLSWQTQRHGLVKAP